MTARPAGWLIGTCKACKTTRRIPGISTLSSQCPCGQWVKMTEIWASRNDKPCDARCLSAQRASCDCSCGGENHGSQH